MSYKLQITDQQQGFNANVRYENLSKAEKPEIVAKTSTGVIVHERTTYNGTVLTPGSTQRQWVDDQGGVYSKQDLTFTCGDQVVSEVAQTKVFEVVGYQPLINYTDNYIIDKYYEIYADDNGMKKDIDKARAVASNTYLLKKLWEYLDKNQVVARGEFCTASRGFIASDGYIRAIKIPGNKWGLEIGVFKEEKVFQHVQESIPLDVPAFAAPAAGKRLKMVNMLMATRPTACAFTFISEG